MITSTIRKIQAIANLLSGQPLGINPRHLDPPWSRYYQFINKILEDDPAVEPAQLRYWFIQEFGSLGNDRKDQDLANYELISAAIKDPIQYHAIEHVLDGMPDLEWLWHGWIPRAMLTVLAATPGTGKSYLMLDIARRLIAGGQWPDEFPIETPGRVLYVDAENAPAIMKERLSIWQPSEMRGLFAMWPAPDRLVINLDDDVDRDRFLDMVCVIQPDLVIIDSYGSATLRGETNKEDVQGMLAFLAKVSLDYSTGMILVHHLRKRIDGQTTFMRMTIDSIRGSSHIPAMARNVIGMQWVPTNEYPDENGPRALWVMKSNIGRYPEGLGIHFEPHPENPEIAQLTYTEEPTPFREPTKTEQCQAWLARLLEEAGEPMRPKEIFELAEEEGFNRRMVSRVRKRLDDMIRDTDDKHNSDNCWVWVGESEESE